MTVAHEFKERVEKGLYITPKFRVAFPALQQPRAFGQQDPKYGLVMLIPKSEFKSNWQGIASLVKGAIAKQNWSQEKKTQAWQYCISNLFKDGDAELARGKEYDGYAGCVVIRTATGYQPGTVNLANDLIPGTEIYGGSYARASVTAYAWEHMGRVGCSLSPANVQKIEDGTPFGNRRSAEMDFNDVPTEVQQAAGARDAFADSGDGEAVDFSADDDPFA